MTTKGCLTQTTLVLVILTGIKGIGETTLLDSDELSDKEWKTVKTKYIVALSIALLISIFANIALGFNVSSTKSISKELEEKERLLEEKLHELTASLEKAQTTISNEQLVSDQLGRETIEEFFYTQFSFTTETYQERFIKIKEYVNDEVYGQLTTAGIPDTPSINFENHINEMKLFLDVDNNKLQGIVMLDTVYVVESVPSPEMTQIFYVVVDKNEQNGKYQIINLEVIGTFTSMVES